MTDKTLGNFFGALVLVIGVVLAAATLFRAPAPPAPETAKLRVVASFYPLAYFSEQIGGDLASVVNITPAGAEPHGYEPTAQDITAIENSQLLVLNGQVEPWADRLSQIVNLNRSRLVIASDGLADRQLEQEGQLTLDPHVWLSPPLAARMVEKIAQGFAAANPAHTAAYQSNAAHLKARLAALDQAFRQGLRQCAKNSIITSHAAFGYLAAAYGLEQIPIAGLSPDAEPSPSQLAKLADFARVNNISVIFFESLAGPKLAQTLARETDARSLVLNPLEGLTPAELKAGQDYFTVMQNNLANLQIALQCAP